MTRHATMTTRLAALLIASLGVGVVLAPAPADAFCGFYVSGADTQLYNNATMVTLMRDGTRTVLSMQNNYEGPPEDFAMVVPVPIVLSEDNVVTLPREIFDRVDQMAAPRLVEYWEQDPCNPHQWDRRYRRRGATRDDGDDERSDSGEVVIEAQFTVGEYEIVILSASDSAALDTWLRANEYRIPEGAEAVLRPYVAAGMKFFVAKVDVEQVTFEDNQAMLSPLRMHYDTETFNLPIRLGMLNANGPQDLIVHILAPNGQRYEVANYPNVTIPTNFDVADESLDHFAAFFAALFDKTLERNPGAVVTEYAWAANTCDPCPGPMLNQGDFLTLGADVLPSSAGGGFVLTRLHARYTAASLGEDLIFRAAGPIVGGREMRGGDGNLEHGATASSVNNFQGRYAIRHPWEGAVVCESPQYGVWGGPPGGGNPPTRAARDLAFAERGSLELTDFLRQDVPELGLTAGDGGSRKASPARSPATASSGCSTVGASVPWSLALVAFLALLAGRVQRRRATR